MKGCPSIPDRIREIVRRAPKCGVAVDVGCDHGYIGYLLLSEGKAERVIETDISAPCLDKAKKLFQTEGISCDRATFLLGDGLDGLDADEKLDCVIIAGMGGLETQKIIGGLLLRESGREAEARAALVLQPMRNVPRVRDFLFENGYSILLDEMFFDKGKRYDVIVARFCEGDKKPEKPTEAERLLGRDNILNARSDFLDYCRAELDKRREIAKKISSGGGCLDEETLNAIKILESVTGNENK